MGETKNYLKKLKGDEKGMKLELDISEEKATAIQNFFREAKYLILLGEQGESKVVVLK